MNTEILIIAGVIFSGIVGSCYPLTDEPRCSGADIEARLQGKVLQLDIKILAEKVAKLEEELKEAQRKPSTRLGKDGTYCPDEMTSFRGSCYFRGNDAMTLSSATKFCAARGGRLVVVETSTEHVFLAGYLRNYNDTAYWIGISDMSTEGVWKRLDNDQPVNFTAWGPNEPENRGGNEDCAILAPQYTYSWGDTSCSRITHVLCEISQNE